MSYKYYHYCENHSQCWTCFTESHSALEIFLYVAFAALALFVIHFFYVLLEDLVRHGWKRSYLRRGWDFLNKKFTKK